MEKTDSSMMTRERLEACRRIAAVLLDQLDLLRLKNAYSTISNMKVLLSLNKSSLAPILLNTLSTIPISAASAGTKLPHCARIQMTAVCLRRVDFPP